MNIMTYNFAETNKDDYQEMIFGSVHSNEDPHLMGCHVL